MIRNEAFRHERCTIVLNEITISTERIPLLRTRKHHFNILCRFRRFGAMLQRLRYRRSFTCDIFIGRNIFIARTRSSQRLASFFFLNGFDGSACFTSYIEQVHWKLTYQCSLQYVGGSIVIVTSASINSNVVVVHV